MTSRSVLSDLSKSSSSPHSTRTNLVDKDNLDKKTESLSISKDTKDICTCCSSNKKDNYSDGNINSKECSKQIRDESYMETYKEDLKTSISNSNMVDMRCLALITLVEKGFPDSVELTPPDLQIYHAIKDRIRVVSPLIYVDNRVLVPFNLRQEVTYQLLNASSRTAFMILFNNIFWPTLVTDIRQALSSNCRRSIVYKRSFISFIPPLKPFQCIYLDIVRIGNCNKIMIIDRFSKWVTFKLMHGGVHGLISKLKFFFLQYGVCEEITTPHRFELHQPSFKLFLLNWGINHQDHNDPYYFNQSDVMDLIPRMEDLLKKSVQDEDNINEEVERRLLLQYANELSIENELSPAICLFGTSVSSLENASLHSSWLKRNKSLERNTSPKWIKIIDGDENERIKPKIGHHIILKRLLITGEEEWSRTGIVVDFESPSVFIIRLDGSGNVILVKRCDFKVYKPLLGCHSHISSCLVSQLHEQEQSAYCEQSCVCWLCDMTDL